MTVSYATFDRLKTKGVTAFRPLLAKEGVGGRSRAGVKRGVQCDPSRTRVSGARTEDPLCPPLVRGEQKRQQRE